MLVLLGRRRGMEILECSMPIVQCLGRVPANHEALARGKFHHIEEHLAVGEQHALGSPAAALSVLPRLDRCIVVVEERPRPV